LFCNGSRALDEISQSDVQTSCLDAGQLVSSLVVENAFRVFKENAFFLTRFGAAQIFMFFRVKSSFFLEIQKWKM